LISLILSKAALKLFLLFFIFLLILPSYSSIADDTQWDADWSYHQEIKIPFDTGLEIAQYQPIDIKVDFKNPCWAKNDLEHSIRIVCWDGSKWNELESQIYGLETIKENYISSCNVVFLIPDFADGSEIYYIYYDDSEKYPPDYIDHVEIDEKYYRYEPIPGYPLESHYYKIIDDDIIPYVVSYEGQLMGYNTCQHVTKLQEGTTEVLPKYGEVFAAFDFKYTYEKSLFGYSSTSQKVLSKEVLVDGNLMLEFKITSTSKFNDLQTTATYKYYHCPSKNTRVHTHVKHETLKGIEVTSIPPATNTDGVFASLQGGGVKCKSIKDLNIGEILPFMHFHNELGTISEYDIDTDPEYISDENPDIRIISYKDDVDLGENAWFSFDEGEIGQSHSVIFNKNSILVSGTNEQDGFQLNAFEVDYPHMLGFENNVATIQAGRNSFETGGKHDLVIPDDFVVEFDAEFFSSKTGGYSIIDDEASIFRELVKIKPKSTDGSIDDDEEIVKHDLSVYVHFAQSMPLGSSLSALLGLNFSHINVELYKDDEYLYSENAVRLPMNPLPETEDLGFFKKIVETLKIFDIKNISLFKKAKFPKIEEGKYVIKIFKENPLFSKEKQYIGYAIVDLKQDEKIHVICKSEASMVVNILDQNNKTVKNIEVNLQRDNVNIAKGLTGEKGQAIVKAPTSSKAYDLKIIYNGLVIHQEPLKLGFIQKIRTPKKTINIERHNLILKVTDTWGLIPEVDLNPALIIEQTENPIRIRGQKLRDDRFIFTNLTPNSYQLNLVFKSFNINKNIDISEDKEINLEFPAEYEVKLILKNAKGMPYENSNIVVTRYNEKFEIQNQESETKIVVPPGEYQIEIYNDDSLIGVRNIGVYGEQKYELITNHHPTYPTIIIIVGILLIIFSMIISYYKRDMKYFFLFLTIVLVVISLFLPWWEVNGSKTNLQTSTKLYIIPNSMITLTSTENTIAGEPTYIPPEFEQAILVMIVSALAGCILLILNQWFEKTNKNRLAKLSKITPILALGGTISIFIIAMHEFTRVTIGSISGSSYFDINVPGESQIQSVLLNWGPSIGFFICLAAVIFLLITFTINFFTNKRDNQMKNENKHTTQHPLFGISTKKWMKLLEKNKGVDNKYLDRGIFITLSSIFTAPVRILFKLKYDSKINNLKIKHPPVIIIGHWRSGTTYLHELLSEDPQYCYVTLWHTMLPDSFLILEPIKKFLSNFLPKKRPMDEIKVDIDGPYEEEAAIAVFSTWSFFNGLHFAKNAEEQYLKSIHFEGLTDDEKNQWKQDYLKFMKSVTYANNGKRLLLKNPANTGRIQALLEIFPDAKFIHIYRNPYKVYLSTVKMRNNVLDKLALQEGNKEEIEKQVIKNYKRLMKSYFEQVKLIPKDRLVDIRYEDLVKNPMKEVKKIYTKLKIPGLEKAIPGMKKYLDSKKDYKVNVYKIDKKILQRVKDNWSFTLDLWNYKPPE
jgi:hypothetical protein